MKLIFKFFSGTILSLLFIVGPEKSIAWGPEGHAIVGRLAMHFVKDDVRQNILRILGTMSVDTAANWMDIMKSNQDYDFMRPWHYIDFPKEQPYQPGNEENIINRLIITFNELKHRNTLCDEQIKTDLLILMHLMGDLHMPLHAGYPNDLGGNKVMVQYDTMRTHNLHRFWDEDIITLNKITLQDCLELYQKDGATIDSIKKIDFVSWMKESRSLLNKVYDYHDYTITNEYLQKSKLIVQKQLVLAGLRLASLLGEVFSTPAPSLNKQELNRQYKNSIDVRDAIENIGKNVTVCSRVYGVRYTSSITQINLGDKYPNSPLTIVIFPKNYPNFKLPLDEIYRDKNICVKGKIEEYKGKPQIIIEDPKDIIIL